MLAATEIKFMLALAAYPLRKIAKQGGIALSKSTIEMLAMIFMLANSRFIYLLLA
jgi:hypothetical protein